MKYMIYIDYKADYKGGSNYCYKPIEAKTLEEAIEIADSLWNENIYLARIMKKIGNIEKVDGCKVVTYEAVLCRRSYGWHLNNKANCESAHYAKRWIAKYGDWTEAC